MKKIFFFFFLATALIAEAQPSLSFINHWQLTPNNEDTSGVFCRTYYNANRNKYYTVYAGRPANQIGPMQYYAWREYDPNMNFTGSEGTLSGHTNAGDFAMEMVGSYYYHVAPTFPWSFKLSKYDEDFNLVSSVTFPLDSADSQADMLLNYTNGRLIIGAMHVPGEYHPSMPVQQSSWQPVMHKWEYDLNLNSLTTDVYLNRVFTTWGASCIYNNNQYNIITMHKWPMYNFRVYHFDNNWNYIDSTQLNTDGQWGQGVLWDGTNYYVSYHSGHEHRSGNITVAIYDNAWNLEYDTTITNNSVFVFNSSPTPNTTQYNANRPYMVRVGDTLVVSYDEDNYQLTSFIPLNFQHSKEWMAHVTKLRINAPLTVAEINHAASWAIYPNPANESITIQTTETGNVEIYNSVGMLVKSEQIMNSNQIISTAELSSGIYILCFKTTNGFVEKRKLVIE
jgi:hypothetical protein